MGDYISKAVAINKIMENIVHQDSHDVNLHNIGLRKAMSAIGSLPAADVVEVRHGRWSMLSYDEAVCTRCGYNRNTPFDSTREARESWGELPPYCEMCGAKMDGGQDDV